MGNDNISKRVSDLLNRDSIAPRFWLAPETFLEPIQRIGEFAPDKNGRITFEEDNFEKYLESFKGINFGTSIGTHPYKIFKGKAPDKRSKGSCFSFYDKNPE